MTDADLRARIADQFSYRGSRADVWRGFDAVLDTDAYLNLGYSGRFQSHLVGSPQARLVDRVGDVLAACLPRTSGLRLLDLGSGRGGPAVRLAERFDARVVGVDLVPYNVARATENAAARGVDAGFVVGDATRLPVAPDAVDAAVAVDSLVYVADKRAAFSEVANALRPGGVVVCSDLLRRRGDGEADSAVARFADAWDMPTPVTVGAYADAVREAGLTVRGARELTPHSVGRFRKWTTLYLVLAGSPAGGLLARGLRRYDLDPDAVTEQVRRAHDALPSLRHVVVAAEA